MKHVLQVAFIFLSFCSFAFGDSDYSESHAVSLALDGQVKYFVDVSGDAKPFLTTSIDQMVDQYGFSAFTKSQQNLGYEHAAHWVLIDLTKQNLSDDQSWFLRYQYPLLDYIDLYRYSEEQTWELIYETGDMRSYSSRPIDQVNYYFPLKKSDDYILLRLKTNGALIIPLSIVNQSEMNQYEKTAMMLFGVFFGALGVMCFYNLFIYLFTRITSYFYYVSVLFFILVYLLAMSGYGYEWVWRDNGQWVNEHIQPIAVGLIVAYGCLFTRQVLQLPIYFPRLNNVFIWLTRISFGVAIAGFFLPLTVLIHLISIVPIVTIGLVVFGGTLAYKRGVDGAGLFLVAWSAGLLGAVFFTLHQWGVLPPHWFFVHGLKLGVLVNTMFLSFGLVSYINSLREENRRAEAQAHENYRMALIDSLTGIPNRRAFDHQYRLEYRRCQREQSPLSLLMVDVDFFKNYNDTYGHRGGDAALTTVANIIGGQLSRAGDRVFRYGGEEFVVMLPETKEDGASFLAARIVDAIETERLPHAASPFKHLTVSVGLATETEYSADSLSLIEAADERLYEAKNGGRNQFRSTSSNNNVHQFPGGNRHS